MTTFQELTQGNQFEAGTNEAIRVKVMQPIIAANPEKITIKVKGVELTLTANWSLSRKSMSYYGTITAENYIAITGSNFGLKKDTQKNSPYFTMGDTGCCEIHAGGNYYEKFMTNKGIEIL